MQTPKKSHEGYILFIVCINFFACSGQMPQNEQLIERDDVIKLKRCMYANQCSSLPPIVTHNMQDDENDPSEFIHGFKHSTN